ncbi:MAG: pyridoxamine 5'-phosphate oxidase family protein [Acidimicrobiia bacterium]|jgi:nitroimidazol reductase NimA-like FMN-containing flavoprotein (pyridoxamine 5'-phosphate oxidase superfamily)|nr:pyridoxamine 5'-phosphate oxidase family protein [Acidimicrobiia bacterium]
MIELTPGECRAVLEAGRVAHIAQIDGGEPYVTPMSFVVLGGDLVFRTGAGRRLAALRSDPRVCVEVSRPREDAGWESVLVWGRARLVDDPRLEAEAVAALLAKYHTESALGFSAPAVYPEERPVVAITPEKITGRASGGGLSAATRPGRL